MSVVVKLDDGTVIDSANFDCGTYSKMFLECALETYGPIKTVKGVALYCVRYLQDLITGVTVSEHGEVQILDHRMDLIKAASGALRAFEMSYPELNLRSEWAQLQTVAGRTHCACIADSKYALTARIAASWWDARVALTGAPIEIEPKNLETELWRLYEQRNTTDKYYQALTDEVAATIDKVLYDGSSIILTANTDWFVEDVAVTNHLLRPLRGRANNLSISYSALGTSMKVTPTRVMLSEDGGKCYELYPGGLVDDAPRDDQMIYRICSRNTIGRLAGCAISFAEYCRDD